MSLLIVEDNPMLIKALSYTFKKAGFKQFCAIDGLQAKEIFDQEQPDMVVSDLMLPFITGLELIEHIRETEAKYTKIIALSSMKTEDTINLAFDLGVDDYITKPYISSELLARTKRLLNWNIKTTNK